MTLVIGVRCSDAVVLAADSAATLGSLGTETVWQPTSEKVEVVDDRALIAVSGPVGLGQRFKFELSKMLPRSGFLKRSSTEVMVDLSNAFRGHLEQEFSAARSAGTVFGQQLSARSVATSTLVALTASGGPTLIEFDQQGSPEELTVSLPFSCIGSGKALADAYMTLFKGLFWPVGELPSRGQAEFAAYRAMTQSIAVAPGHLGPPVHVYRLIGDGNRYVASVVEQAELDEHNDSIEDATRVIREWREGRTSTTASETIESPPE